MTETELCAAAAAATDLSYSPYSGCKVGAALLTDDGSLYCGCNIENAAFSPTVCAERVALFKAISEGKREFKMIAIAGRRGKAVTSVFPPCGVCRQVLSEFCPPDMPVLLVKNDGFERYTLSQLLPISFDSTKVTDI